MKEADYITATILTRVRVIVDQLHHVIEFDGTIGGEELSQIAQAVDVWLMRLEKRVGSGKRSERVPRWPLRWATPSLKPGDTVLLVNQLDPSMNGVHRIGRARKSKS